MVALETIGFLLVLFSASLAEEKRNNLFLKIVAHSVAC